MKLFRFLQVSDAHRWGSVTQIWNSACLRIRLVYQKLELTTDGTCLGEFESRVRAKKSFTRHSRDIHATVARYSRDRSATFMCEYFYTLVAIESSHFSVCQHVRVKISNSSASVVALTAFVIHLPNVRPHLYLKTWCVTQGRHW